MDDVKIAKTMLSNIPVVWNGKDCVLELKIADYNWRQMEWPGFYFEYLCRSALQDAFTIPGERIGSVTFDAKRAINWDFKSKTISSSDHGAILNDVSAMDESIHRYGMHGVIVAMCEADYDDASRSFQEWHSKLKGGLSNYEKSRIVRTPVSRGCERQR